MFPKLRINHASWGYSSGIEWKWPERKLKLEDNEFVQILQALKHFIEYLTVGKQILGQTRFLEKHVLLKSDDLSSNHWTHMKTDVEHVNNHTWWDGRDRRAPGVGLEYSVQ